MSSLVQALTFGDLAGTSGRYFVLLLLYLGVFAGLFLVMLVQITVGFGTLGGKGVVMSHFQAERVSLGGFFE